MNPSNKKIQRGNSRIKMAQKEREDLRTSLWPKGFVPEFPVGEEETRTIKNKTVRRQLQLLDKEEYQPKVDDKTSSSTPFGPVTPPSESTKHPEDEQLPRGTLSLIHVGTYTHPQVESPKRSRKGHSDDEREEYPNILDQIMK